MFSGRAQSIVVVPLMLLVAVGVILFTSPQELHAQTAHVVSDRVLYWNIFRHVLWLKHTADAAQQKGKDRSSLRHIVARQIGLNDSEGALLESVALQCETDVAAHHK